jgi:hypothetical protein
MPIQLVFVVSNLLPINHHNAFSFFLSRLFFPAGLPHVLS